MFKAKNLIFLSIFVLLVGCSGGDDDSINAVEVTISSSNEEPNYNETYTISWESNASQCYASGPLWSGERELSGSEEFTIKRGGNYTFILECRRNNEFKNQAVLISVNKTLQDHFIFDATEASLLTYPLADDSLNYSITSFQRGEFNNDVFGDLFIALEARNINGGFEETLFFQVNGGAETRAFVVGNVVASGEQCQGSRVLLRSDINSDGYDDIFVATSDQDDASVGQTACLFMGSAEGFSADNTAIQNDTDFDFFSTEIKFAQLADRNSDGLPDIYMLTNDAEYWIIRSEEPALEKVEIENSILSDYTITSGIIFDFENTGSESHVFTGYDSRNSPAYIVVPVSGVATEWENLAVYLDVPLTKHIQILDFDSDATLDVLVLGDENINLPSTTGASSLLRVYEYVDTNFLDSYVELDLLSERGINLSTEIYIQDFDLDADGGDFIIPVNTASGVTDNFFLGLKQANSDDDGIVTYSFDSYTDKLIGIPNFDFENKPNILSDFNFDLDLDIVVISESLDANGDSVLEILLKENLSN